MADDDLETGRPRESGRIPIGRSPLGFSQALTLFLSLMLLGALVCFTLPGSAVVHMYSLERPAETTQRVLERNLWVEDAVTELPSWARDATRSLLGASGSPHEDAIDAFEDVVAKNGYSRPDALGDVAPVDPALLDGLRARRAVLLAASGRLDEALGDLQRLEITGRASFAEAVRTAYSALKPARTAPFSTFDLAPAGDDWIGMHLAERLAERVGDTAEAARRSDAIAERRAHFAARVQWIALLQGACIAVGLLVLLVWLARNRPEVRRASAEMPPVWTFEAGYAVCVRGAFGAILVMFALEQIGTWSGRPEPRALGVVLMGLPLVWFARRRLVTPFGSTMAATFGFRGLRGPLAWVGITLAVYALGALGGTALADLVRLMGSASHWTEGVQAGLIWSSPPAAALELFGTCVFLPLVAELGFRGVFYATLRRHYAPWRAALLTAALVAATSVSTLPTFASILWISFVLAIAYETTRSLVPGILFACLASATTGVSTWLLWR